MTQEEENSLDELMDALLLFAKKCNYSIVTPNSNVDDEDEIDFININLRTNTIYFTTLDIDKPLTEVG